MRDDSQQSQIPVFKMLLYTPGLSLSFALAGGNLKLERERKRGGERLSVVTALSTQSAGH